MIVLGGWVPHCRWLLTVLTLGTGPPQLFFQPGLLSGLPCPKPEVTPCPSASAWASSQPLRQTLELLWPGCFAHPVSNAHGVFPEHMSRSHPCSPSRVSPHWSVPQVTTDGSPPPAPQSLLWSSLRLLSSPYRRQIMPCSVSLVLKEPATGLQHSQALALCIQPAFLGVSLVLAMLQSQRVCS